MNTLLLALALAASAPLAPDAVQRTPDADPPFRSTTRVLIVASGIASMVDYGVTMYGVAGGQFREANPALVWAERRPVAMGVTKGAILAASTYVVLRLHRSHPHWALVTAAGMAALNVYVATRNAQMLPPATHLR